MSGQAPPLLPYKSTAVALLFCIILGPIGLLYASFWGGFIMTLVGFVVLSSKLLVPIIMLWAICCIWGARAIDSYNKKIFRASIQKE